MTVYNFPIWLRKLTFKSLKDYYSKSDNDENNPENVLVKGKESFKQKQKEYPKVSIPDYIMKKPKK